MAGKVKRGVGEPFTIQRRFQVEVDALASFGKGVGEGRFANLTRPEEGDSREMGQAVRDNSLDSPRDHPCNYGMACQIYGVHDSKG
jgi:hypothetical protein